MSSNEVIFHNTLGWSRVNAVFTGCGRTKQCKMDTLPNSLARCCIGAEFDDVYFTNGANGKTAHTAFNRLCSSFEPNGFTYDSDIICLQPYEGDFHSDTNTHKLTFEFAGKAQKNVYVWTPSCYNPVDKDKKYGVVYMFDGQNLFSKGSTAYGSWNVPQVMECRSDYIVVGIDNSDHYRDSQLTPDIGKIKKQYTPMFENGTGIQMAQLLLNKIIPYINKNYNVFTDKSHTAIAGGSSGGLESFYIGTSYSDIFGIAGAFSPSFVLYENSVWENYLKSIKLCPKMYIYTGKNDLVEKELYPQVERTVRFLKSSKHSEKLVYDCREFNFHNESAWAGAFIKFAAMLE